MSTAVYNIRNLKIFRGMEGHGFNATLYLGKQRLGAVIDDASGGPLSIELSLEDRKALEEYVQSLPEVTCPFNDPNTGKPAVLKPSVELFVSNLANRTDMLKRVKRILKNPCMIAVIENGSLYKIEYTNVNSKVISDYRKDYPDHLVLNRLSDDEIMAALEAHGL